MAAMRQISVIKRSPNLIAASDPKRKYSNAGSNGSLVPVTVGQKLRQAQSYSKQSKLV